LYQNKHPLTAEKTANYYTMIQNHITHMQKKTRFVKEILDEVKNSLTSDEQQQLTIISKYLGLFGYSNTELTAKEKQDAVKFFL
jgi:Mg2+ and Co2+ transporter CorA